MDATENDLPPNTAFKVQGFPTIKFKPAGSSEYIDYAGDRSLDSLIAFVEEHAKNDLTLPAKTVKDEVTSTKVSPSPSSVPDTSNEHEEL